MAASDIQLDSIWEIQAVDFHQEKDNQQEFMQIRRRGQTLANQIQPEQGPRFGGGRNSIIGQPYAGGFSEKPKTSQTKYILRHYLTGKVLTTIDKKEGQNIIKEGIINDFEMSAKEQQFEIQTAKKGCEEMIQQAYVKVIQDSSELQLKTVYERTSSKSTLRRNSSFSNMEMFFKSLNEDDLDYIKHNVAFAQTETLHAFQINKITDEQKRDLLFIISSQEILLQFADILKLPVKQVEQQLNDKVLACVQDVLRSLLAYVLKLEDKNDIEKSETLPFKKRQIYLKDLSMIEVIMEIIFFISYKNGIETLFRRWKSEREKLKNIYKLSYKLIEKMTKNNPLIKLHVSQWLELFLHQAMNIDDISVQNTLSELLDDNYQAISKFITKTSLKRLVDILKQRVPHEKYLKILSAISVCKGKSIINNQIHTLQMFFQQISTEFKFQFKQENYVVYVLSHIGRKDLKWRSLKDFNEESMLNDDLQSWNYFLSYFNLLSDVCMNRNKFAKKYVEENFSLSILCSVIEDPDCMETNAIEPFLKLIHFAYINCQHYTPIRRIARVREWHTIETKNDILRTHAEASLKPENCDLKRVMNFIERFLEEFNFFNSKQRNYNNILFTLLQVLKTTLELGFWKSVTNLQSFLPNLIKICSCNKDFHYFRDEDGQNEIDKKCHFKKAKQMMTRINMENIIIMKCKMLACEIIDIMMDMETNVRVSKSTQILKKMINQNDLAEEEQKEQKKQQPQPPQRKLLKHPTTIQKQGSSRKIVQNLLVLEEKHQQKRRTSLIYQFLDRQPQESNTDQKIEQMDVFKNMASVFKKSQEKQQLQEKNIYDINIWIENFRSLIDDRSLFVKLSKEKYILEVLFAELSLFDNPQMVAFGLQLLQRIYGQRRELMDNFEKIIIVFQGFTYTLSVESRVTRTKLLALNDRNILSATLENQKDFNAFIWRESENPKETGIIQDLHYLVQTLKRGEIKKSEIKINYEDLYPENGLTPIFTEKEQNHKLHQSLLKWQDLHLSIFPFLEIAIELKSDKSLLLKCVHICYNYLAMLVQNHLDNKLDFFINFDIKKLYRHLQYNVGCISFIREIYTNNKMLLFSEKHATSICCAVIQYCNKIDIQYYYKAQLLDFFRVLILFNNKPIKINQILVMSKLQERQNDNLIFLLRSEQSHYEIEPSKIQPNKSKSSTQRPTLKHNGNLFDEEAFLFWIDEYQLQYEQAFQTKILNISAELTYMYTFFQLFQGLIEDGNEINIGKCKNMHPYHKLLQMLPWTQNCWPLKKHLRGYINRLYYMGEEYEEMSQLIIEFDLDNILLDLQDIIDIKIQADILQLDTIKLQNPVRYTYLASYIYLNLEEILISLNTFLNKQKFLDDLEDQLIQNFSTSKFKLHIQLIQIGVYLSQIKKLWCYSKYIQQFCKILIQILKEIYHTFDLSLLLIRESLFLSAMQMNSIQEIVTIERSYRDDRNAEPKTTFYSASESSSDPVKHLNSQLNNYIGDKINGECTPSNFQEYLSDVNNQEKLKVRLIEDIFHSAEKYLQQLQITQITKEEKVQQSLKRMFQIKNPEENKEDINEVLNKKHRKLMNTLSLSTKFHEFNEEEFIQVCEQLNNIDKESERIYGTNFPVITLKEFIKNIIQLNINNPHQMKDDLRIFFLKVLARIITSKNQKQALSIDYWTPEYWTDEKAKISEAQNFLDDCGAAELICHLLKEPNLEARIPLTNELLIFGVAYLLGGNTRCQNSILVRMKEDHNNIMLTNYSIMIKKIGRVIYNNFKIRKTSKRDQSAQFQVILADNYDFYDEKMSMLQRYHQIEPDDAKETAFKKQCLDIMCRSYRVLQLLCENNNVNMKNFLRQQTDNNDNIRLNTINFIEFTTSQLRIFLKILNKYITCIPNFMLDFLIEVTQLPCLENQLTLCKTTFFEDSCYLSQFFSSKNNQIARLYEDPEDIESLQELYNKIITEAMSVLEGQDDRIYEEIQNKLEPRFLIEIIKQNLEALQVQNGKEMQRLLELQEEMYSEEIVEILNVLMIKQKIKLKMTDKCKWVKDLNSKIQSDQNLQQIIQLMELKIRNIEIVYQEKTQMIFFPSHPVYEYLSDQTKDKIMFTINRETQREKILGLLEAQKMIFNEIEYNHKLNQLSIPVTHRTIQHLRTAAATLSILLNIFMVVFYAIDVKNKTANYSAEFHEEQEFISIHMLRVILVMLSLLQFTLSTATFIVYLVNFGPLCLKLKGGNNEQEKIEEFSDSIGEQQEEEIITYKDRLLNLYQDLKKTQISMELIKQKGILVSKYIITNALPFLIKVYQKTIIYVEDAYFLAMNEENFIQFFLFWINAFLGTFFRNYFFSLHLFDIFSRLSLLKNVFQAISYNAKQLLVVAMLGVLFVFSFSFSAFDTYVDDIYEDEQPEESCISIIQCMITLITSGVIGNSMSKWDPVKFIFDTLYFVFFGLLFTNIVSGIMIDTFAELRDQRQKIEDDKKNKCFICGVDRQTLEKSSDDFEEHIQTKHYLWNYIFYIYGLKKKDSTEYTGLEYALYDMIYKEDISWFPMISTDNTSIIENFEVVNKKFEQLKTEMEERHLEVLETVKTLMAEKNQDQEGKEKKK